MRRSAIARAFPLVMVSLAAVAGSCTDVVTNPTVAVAISFDTLPYPAVVTGDTLRDSLGRAAPMHAVAFNSSGSVIANAPIRYIAIDTGITIDPTGIVTAQARTGKIRIVASVNSLQSIAETLVVARQPNGVLPVGGALTDTLHYALPDNPSTNVSCPLAVQVTTADTAGGITGTQGWLVSYQAFHNGQPLVQSDTTLATLWDGLSSNATIVDTTAADGTAARRLRVRPQTLTSTNDSIIVVATVRYRGVSLAGSPIRFVVYTAPPLPPGTVATACPAVPIG